MNILGTQVYNAGAIPLRKDGRGADASKDAARRSESQQNDQTQNGAATGLENVLQASQAALEPVQAAELQRDITRISGLTATAKQYALYPDQGTQGTTTTQLKALTLYRDTQNLSRIDSNIDYLGSIDVKV